MYVHIHTYTHTHTHIYIHIIGFLVDEDLDVSAQLVRDARVHVALHVPGEPVDGHAGPARELLPPPKKIWKIQHSSVFTI
jgi:hypothetical protein